MSLTPVRSSPSDDRLAFEAPFDRNAHILGVVQVDEEGQPVSPVVKREVVVLPMEPRAGEVITPRYEVVKCRTMLAILNVSAWPGSGYLDLYLEIQDPATGEWARYVDWDNIANGVGLYMAMCDPVAVQGDFGVAKVVVKRVPVPVSVRFRITPNFAETAAYSLSVVLGQ